MLYLIIFLALIAIILGPKVWVNRVLTRYSRPNDRYAKTGARLARYLLDLNDLKSVEVEVTKSGDHYDPIKKIIRLTEDNYNNGSLTAITVAAHEVGHALQDHHEYLPLKWRTRLVSLMSRVEKIGAALLIISPFMTLVTKIPTLSIITLFAGFMTLGSSVVVHSVTLPVELDASFKRALPLLKKNNILLPVDYKHSQKLLTAASLTYLSASLMSLLNIARWIAILRR